MTDKERIVYLRAALKNLTASADRYIDDGSWIEHLSIDVKYAQDVLKATRYSKEEQSIRDAVYRSMTGEK
jgi:hypothetical protein